MSRAALHQSSTSARLGTSTGDSPDLHFSTVPNFMSWLHTSHPRHLTAVLVTGQLTLPCMQSNHISYFFQPVSVALFLILCIKSSDSVGFDRLTGSQPATMILLWDRWG